MKTKRILRIVLVIAVFSTLLITAAFADASTQKKYTPNIPTPSLPDSSRSDMDRDGNMEDTSGRTPDQDNQNLSPIPASADDSTLAKESISPAIRTNTNETKPDSSALTTNLSDLINQGATYKPDTNQGSTYNPNGTTPNANPTTDGLSFEGSSKIRLARLNEQTELCLSSDLSQKVGLLGKNTLVTVTRGENGALFIQCFSDSKTLGVCGWVKGDAVSLLSESEVEWVHASTPEEKPVVLGSSGDDSPSTIPEDEPFEEEEPIDDSEYELL
ncbi:MAG: hypothetical protein Q4F31_10160 [Eubacteriales bacterium]|nr:hypothetical protein [Eubacteriales bacterium]